MQHNKNNHGSVFGGSLAMLGIVAGYALTYLLLEEEFNQRWPLDFHLVIKDFACQYKRPVTSDAVFEATIKGDVKDFITQLSKNHKATLSIELQAENHSVTTNARYVAIKKLAKSA